MAVKHHWFKKAGWLYHPVTWQGMILTVLLLIFMAHVFVAIDARTVSVVDTFYGIFPFWVPAILTWLWIGSKTSAQ